MPKRGGAVRTVDIGWGSPSSIATARSQIFAGCGAVLRNVDPSGDLRVPPIPTCPTVATEHAGRRESSRGRRPTSTPSRSTTPISPMPPAQATDTGSRGFVFRVSKKDGAQRALAKDLVFPSHLTVGGDAVFFTRKYAARRSASRSSSRACRESRRCRHDDDAPDLGVPEHPRSTANSCCWGSRPSDDIIRRIGRVGDLRRARPRRSRADSDVSRPSPSTRTTRTVSPARVSSLSLAEQGGNLVPLGANRNARVLASDRDDLFWSAGERVFRLSKQGGPSLPIGSARAGTRITRLLVEREDNLRRGRGQQLATPKQIVAFPRPAAAQPSSTAAAESNHQAVQPHTMR